MKKKTKFKLRNDLAVPFWIAVCVCLFLAAANYILFHNSFFRSLSKMDEAPIATITFKYKTAQRKFLERVVWDRLRQNSPVYNGDTIHTAEMSEATVWFEDGTTLDLAENTMAQVFLHEDGTLGADLESGSATVDASLASKGMTLSSNKVSLNIESGAKISASKSLENKAVNFMVQKGSATLSDGTSFAEGEAVSVGENADGTVLKLLSVISPLAGEKILNYSEAPASVNFKWTNADDSKKLVLKIADDKNFSHKVKNYDVSGLSQKEISLSKGIWYWKLIQDENENGAGDNNLSDSNQAGNNQVLNRGEACSGKFQIIQALKPSLLTPAAGYGYQYRTKNPSLRFIWTESEAATAYHFKVSRASDMSNPVLEQRVSGFSTIISTLGEGTYYWNVTPYYVVNRIGLANPSETGMFTIERKGELTCPVLYTPTEGEFVNKNKNRINLSWKMEDEASSYKVMISQNQDLSLPLFTRETSENYYAFTGEDVASFKDGQYYWAVKQLDSEGNESPRSLIRSFYAINGKIEHRTIFPPDNYELWMPLSVDTRFTWKSNLMMKQHFQIARDASFNTLIMDTETTGTSYSGLSLLQGEYYWRILALGDTMETSTPTKKLIVVGELEEPVPMDPIASKKTAVRPSESYIFRWQKTPGADYYRVRLYTERGETPLFDQNFVSNNYLAINMDRFEEGIYRWEVQGYCYETESTSRRSSRLASASFTLRRIKPVVLVSPEENATIDGWKAIENPPVLKWSSQEKYASAEIVLTKKSGIAKEKKVYPQIGFSQQLEPLSSGTYEWTVNATTLDDFDISANKNQTFNVKEIPPFDVPVNARTEGGTLFNAAYLKKTPYILFKWQKVARADGYIVEIYRRKKLVHRHILAGNDNNEYKLNDLLSLSKGDFTWTVKAVRLSEDKKEILIDGKTSDNKFTIDYQIKSSGAKRKNKGDLYAL